jgi:hypothetical protein
MTCVASVARVWHGSYPKIRRVRVVKPLIRADAERATGIEPA